MNTPDPTSAINDVNLKNRLLRHLDSCLKEIDADILAIDKRYEKHENFGDDTAMKEMNPTKNSASRNNKISTFDSDFSVGAALNLSMNSSSTAVNDQDENNNGTDDNTFESSSSFHSTRSEQQQQSHQVIETSSSCRVKTKSEKRNFRDFVEKTEDTRSVGITPSKKPRPKSDEKISKMVNFTFSSNSVVTTIRLLYVRFAECQQLLFQILSISTTSCHIHCTVVEN